MAEARRASMAALFILSVAAVATMLGGWVVLVMRDAPSMAARASELDVPSLPPLPTLVPAASISEAPPPRARRPAPIATTRSSR